MSHQTRLESLWSCFKMCC